jgi:hypothetical protein
VEHRSTSRLRPVLRGCTDDLDARAVEQERGHPLDVTRIERLTKGVEDRGRRRAPLVRRRLHELAPRAMERGLDRSHGRGQCFGDFVKREVEHVFQHDRGPLLRREVTEQRARRLSRAPRIGGRVRVSDVRDEGFLGSLTAHPIDPEIRRDTEQPCARVRWRSAHLSERDEGTGKRVLREVLGIPWASREVATVAIEIGSQRFENFEEAMPRRLDRARQLVGRAHAGTT